MREVQLQVKQLLSQEERLAAAVAAERKEEQRGQPSGAEEAGAGDSDGELQAEEAEEGVGSAAGMLQASMALLDQAQGLLEEAEGRVVSYARLHRFSQAEYDELSARLQQV